MQHRHMPLRITRSPCDSIGPTTVTSLGGFPVQHSASSLHGPAIDRQRRNAIRHSPSAIPHPRYKITHHASLDTTTSCL